MLVNLSSREISLLCPWIWSCCEHQCDVSEGQTKIMKVASNDGINGIQTYIIYALFVLELFYCFKEKWDYDKGTEFR